MRVSVSVLLASLSLFSSVSAAPSARQEACTDPVVRKEWRELTEAEKQDYLQAAVCLKNSPSQNYPWVPQVVSRGDDLTYTHKYLTTQIHSVAQFLPWHRWYVAFHESILRNECGYKGVQPYWDWTIDADAKLADKSPIFDPVTGFGGNGVLTGNPTPGFERCVMEGPFANTTLNIGMGWPLDNTPEDRPHCFGREFNNASGNNPDGSLIIGDMQASAYNSATLQRVYDMPNFEEMAQILEGLPHAQIHSVIFGDMGPASSPNEPLFFLHHANVDRIWAKWQAANETRLSDYSGWYDQANSFRADATNHMYIFGLGNTDPVVADYLNIQGGALCYTYSEGS